MELYQKDLCSTILVQNEELLQDKHPLVDYHHLDLFIEQGLLLFVFVENSSSFDRC